MPGLPAHLMFTACLLNSETNLSQPAIYVQCTCTCRCLRRVFGHDQCTSIDFILTKYNLYTFSRRVNLKLFVFVFRCLSRCASHLLSTIFTPLPSPPPPPPPANALHQAAQNKCCYPRSSFSRSEPTQSYIVHVHVRLVTAWMLFHFWQQTDGTRFHLDVVKLSPLSAFVTSTKSFLGFPVKRQRQLGVP